MVHYNSKLKPVARMLRHQMTETEHLIWSRIRGKQLCNVQFYRQRSITSYIVDFYAPAVKLVLEIDGSQHLEKEHLEQDKFRDDFLKNLGIYVVRFDNNQVKNELNSVLEKIFNVIEKFKSCGHHQFLIADFG